MMEERLKEKKEFQLQKKEGQLNKLSEEDVIAELKTKGLPVFGTKGERLDRLKKSYGNQIKSQIRNHPITNRER